MTDWSNPDWLASVVACPDPVAARALADLMSDTSEDCWCAGRLIGTEFALWRIAHAGGGTWGWGLVGKERAAQLLALSAKAGGWVAWAETTGEVFVPAGAWAETFAAYETARAGREGAK